MNSKTVSRPLPSRCAAGLVLLSLAFAGCASTQSSNASTTAKKPASTLPVLVQGMTAEEVIKRVGKPAEIRKMEAGVSAEVWVYDRNAGTVTTMNPTTTGSVTVANPLTGEMYQSPVLNYRPERIDTEQHTELLMVEGRLVSSKQYVTKSHQYE
jgi:hypothetical protein